MRKSKIFCTQDLEMKHCTRRCQPLSTKLTMQWTDHSRYDGQSKCTPSGVLLGAKECAAQILECGCGRGLCVHDGSKYLDHEMDGK